MLIAVVDDDDAARDALAGLLRALGHEVLHFGSAAEFLGSAELARADCLVTDMRMPGMTGLELHRHLAAVGTRIPTLIVTAWPDEALLEAAQRDGVAACLRKPLNAAGLAARLEEIGRRER